MVLKGSPQTKEKMFGCLISTLGGYSFGSICFALVLTSVFKKRRGGFDGSDRSRPSWRHDCTILDDLHDFRCLMFMLMLGSALADAILLAHVYAYAHAYVSCLMPDVRLSNVMFVRGVCINFFFVVSILWLLLGQRGRNEDE
ncbi:hypothetical protein BO82DRAFT_63450 [Aspergillus uvarum CBS 121591]|uniref:Transmembrane protein n=1 Tax=Aspergillus uvarum CBS 121591 TaxID=1448315 RepID=A0A319CBE4_9EURO|nr:hypothetical protein BO82DRAFT_63450 [Aspergillus uvarum CBS 121591]PYH82534.1 hypothetical protein BO82DRAFT_63450 [Aspergillus uvarum CBS 121591]